MRSVARRRIARFLDAQHLVDRAAVRLTVLAASLAALGCGGLDPVQPHEAITDPTQLYMRLRLNHGAVNLSTAAPYDVLQLVATPLDATGAPMTGLPAPTFRSSDTTRVWVTPGGLLQARGEAANVQVIAELVAEGNVRHTDTAMVNVTTNPTPPTLASLSIDPVPPDSAVWAMAPRGFSQVPLVFSGMWTGTRPLVPRALDPAGTPIPGLVIEYTSADPAVLFVNRYVGLLGRVGGPPGQVQLTARTTAYGVTKEATLTYTVNWPLGQIFDIKQESGATVVMPQEVRLAPGGVVMWQNQTAAPVDVVFDDASAATAPPTTYCQVLVDFSFFFGPGPYCESGDMLVPAQSDPDVLGTRVRQFLTPGTYTYRSTLAGVAGTIIVAAAPGTESTTRIAASEP